MRTALRIEHTKPGSKIVRLYDGQGLYLEIAPTGGRPTTQRVKDLELFV